MTFKREQQRISKGASKNVAEDNVHDAAFRQLACSTHVCHSYVAGMRQFFSLVSYPFGAAHERTPPLGARNCDVQDASYKPIRYSALPQNRTFGIWQASNFGAKVRQHSNFDLAAS
jgi:hypothetical protein